MGLFLKGWPDRANRGTMKSKIMPTFCSSPQVRGVLRG